MLSGRDNVEHWTEQSVWDVILHNVRVVLSTHQVLYDALSHGFVKMDGLSLLIFDEGCSALWGVIEKLTNIQLTTVPAIM